MPPLWCYIPLLKSLAELENPSDPVQANLDLFWEEYGRQFEESGYRRIHLRLARLFEVRQPSDM